MKALLVVTVDLSGSAPGIEIRWEGWRTEQEKKKGVSMTLREKVGNKPDPDVKPVN